MTLTHEKAQWAIETYEEMWFVGVEFDYSTLNCVGAEGDLVYYEVDAKQDNGEEGQVLFTFKRIADDPILTHELVDYEWWCLLQYKEETS